MKKILLTLGLYTNHQKKQIYCQLTYNKYNKKHNYINRNHSFFRLILNNANIKPF